MLQTNKSGVFESTKSSSDPKKKTWNLFSLTSTRLLGFYFLQSSLAKYGELMRVHQGSVDYYLKSIITKTIDDTSSSQAYQEAKLK